MCVCVCVCVGPLFSVFFAFFHFPSADTRKSTIWQIFFLSIKIGFRDQFVFQDPREFHPFYFSGQLLFYASTICQDGNISVSCTIPNGLPSQPSRVCSWILFVPVSCIRLLCDLSFYLCQHIAYPWYSPGYNQFNFDLLAYFTQLVVSKTTQNCTYQQQS